MNENLTTNPEELQDTLSADQAETTEKTEQTAQSSEVVDKNAKEGENIPAKIASSAVVTATPPSPPLPPDAMMAYRTLTNSNDAVEKPIEQSPEEIMRLQAIGQWEFLSVEAEELVERHYSGLMSERDLVCIYRGTLRIGVDMRQLPSDWVEMKERSAILHLPQPSLLDENFLDESRTTVFFEQGVFRPEERDAMRTEAKDKMKQRAMTAENLSIARRNAEAQFQKLFLAMGYEDVVVEFDTKTATQHQN